MFIIAGLGNPGAQYAGTRHNMGFDVIDRLVDQYRVPQDGVTGGIDDMDYIILSLPQTKAYIRARYGVDADGLSEDDPGLRGAEGEIAEAEDIVTMTKTIATIMRDMRIFIQ